MWNSCWAKCSRTVFFSEHFRFPLSVLFHRLCIFIFSIIYPRHYPSTVVVTTFFFSPVISNQSTRLLYQLICWLSFVVTSPPARRSLSWIQSLLIDLWLLVNEVSTLSLILLTTQTMVTTEILPLQGKFPW